jgi:hypothetical protein
MNGIMSLNIQLCYPDKDEIRKNQERFFESCGLSSKVSHYFLYLKSTNIFFFY